MKVVTGEQMRRIDQAAIQERGIPGSILMDRAGKAVAREALERFEPYSVAVVTGKGNNAGDGFVAARELSRQGVRAVLVMLRPAEELSGDALDAYLKVPSEIRRLVSPTLEALREELSQHDLIIDAIFGTGIKGPVQSPWAEAIETINTCGNNVLAVDIPSGLPSDQGGEIGPHVRAMMTVTIGLPKLAMVVDPGVRATGTVVVDDIGFPRDLIEDEALSINLMTVKKIRSLLPARNPSGHKGTFGKVIVLGGSEGMTGAAVLTALAATRSGVGLVYSCYPQALGLIMESHLIEPVKIPLTRKGTWFTPEMVEQAVEESRKMDAVAIGPGIGMHPDTGDFLHQFITQVEAPMVIDASGLDLLAKDIEALAKRPGPTVLTPHPAEAARLLGRSVEEVQKDRLGAFLELARKYNVVTVLKGAQTIITSPDGQRFINPTGNSGLAKGGSGDVLTGLIGGLLAQGVSALDAARIGVFIHGMAADIVAEKIGMRAMVPGDVVQSLGEAFLRLEKG